MTISVERCLICKIDFGTGQIVSGTGQK